MCRLYDSLISTESNLFIIDLWNYFKVEAGITIPFVIGHGPQGKIEKKKLLNKKR